MSTPKHLGRALYTKVMSKNTHICLQKACKSKHSYSNLICHYTLADSLLNEGPKRRKCSFRQALKKFPDQICKIFLKMQLIFPGIGYWLNLISKKKQQQNTTFTFHQSSLHPEIWGNFFLPLLNSLYTWKTASLRCLAGCCFKPKQLLLEIGQHV